MFAHVCVPSSLFPPSLLSCSPPPFFPSHTLFPPVQSDSDGLCGCKPGFFFDTDSQSCTQCPLDTYKSTTDLAVLCFSCTGDTITGDGAAADGTMPADVHSYTNNTIGNAHINDCICQEKAGFHHDPYDDSEYAACVCSPGFFYDSSKTACVGCPVGTYENEYNVKEECWSCVDERLPHLNLLTPGLPIGTEIHAAHGHLTVSAVGDSTCGILPVDQDTYHDVIEGDMYILSHTKIEQLGDEGDECQITFQDALNDYTAVTIPMKLGSLSATLTDTFFGGIEGGTTALKETKDYHSCGCPPGDFELHSVCRKCGEGMSCELGLFDELPPFGVTVESIEVEPGYWRPNHDSVVMHACIHSESCTGTNETGYTNGTGLCLEGHEGSYCENCKDEYAKDATTGECILCDPEANQYMSYVVLACMGVGIVIIAALVRRTANGVAKHAAGEAGLAASGGKEAAEELIGGMKSEMAALKAKQQEIMGKLRKMQALYKSARTPLKIFISFSQIISGMGKNFEFKFPVNFSSYLDKIQFINFDLASKAASACLMKPDYYKELEAMTLGPIIAGGGLLAIFFFCSVVKKGDAFYNAIGDEMFKLFLLGTYLVMPGTTVKIFQIFSCDSDIAADGDESYNNAAYGTWLKVDYNKRCFFTKFELVNEKMRDKVGDPLIGAGEVEDYEMDDDYRFYRNIYAPIMLIIYPLGITLMYCVILYRHRYTIDPGQEELEKMLGGEEEGMQEAIRIRDEGPHSHKHSKFAFLYEAYEPKCWWFEIFETVRRLVLTAGMVVLVPGSPLQIAISMILCLISMRVYAMYSPFISARDDVLAEIMQWQIFFTMFAALLMKTAGDSLGAQGATEHGFGILLLVVNGVGPAMLLGNSVLNGDFRMKILTALTKQKESLKKLAEKCKCCAGSIGAAIGALEGVEGLEVEMEERMKKGRPAELELEFTMAGWQKIKTEKDEATEKEKQEAEKQEAEKQEVEEAEKQEAEKEKQEAEKEAEKVLEAEKGGETADKYLYKKGVSQGGDATMVVEDF